MEIKFKRSAVSRKDDYFSKKKKKKTKMTTVLKWKEGFEDKNRQSYGDVNIYSIKY
jgi:uncharacterized iron-regulated protein